MRTGTITITDNAGSESPQTILLSGPGMDFGMSSSSSSASVSPGQTATYALTVAPLGGLNQTVSLTCGRAPSLSTCTVTPNAVTLNGTTPAPVTVSVSTMAGSMAPPFGKIHPPRITGFERILWLYALLMLAGLGVLAGPGKCRPAYWVVGVCLMMMLFWSACGGGGGGTAMQTPGTPAGTYTLSVNATVTSATTSNNLTHSLTLSLTVN
jgi:hypothetical protein